MVDAERAPAFLLLFPVPLLANSITIDPYFMVSYINPVHASYAIVCPLLFQLRHLFQKILDKGPK
jgi:hypothetical protein